MAQGSVNSKPTPAMLRQTADAVFLRGEAEPFPGLLERWSGAVLRHVLDRRDARLLAAAVRRGCFAPAQLTRAARENPALPPSLRLLLTHPELADQTCAPASPSDGDSLERWKFRVGAAYPFLRRAVLEMPCRADRAIKHCGTDGFGFYVSQSDSLTAYEDFQHMLLHCVFRHMAVPEKVQRSLWDLACDLACEYLRAELFPASDSGETRLLITDALPSGCDPRSASSVYKGLMDLFEEDLEPLRRRFPRDDHRYWYIPAPGAEKRRSRPTTGSGEGEGGMGDTEELREQLERQWAAAAETLLRDRKKDRRYGLAPGSREEKMLLRQEGKYDFTRYLRRYSVLREELQLDPGSFDYIPYYYGLERYGNLPFLEPLETSESHKIRDLVIAIDTSGSCSAETVERFLSEIQRILMQRENFFKKMDIHIIQCDSIIQDHTRIQSQGDWKKYLTNLKIRGRGGTNFQPVFTLVEKLRARGELRDLKGLLYFTDGDGAYPRKKTDYETAFVFTDRAALERKLPEWIVPLCLD